MNKFQDKFADRNVLPKTYKQESKIAEPQAVEFIRRTYVIYSVYLDMWWSRQPRWHYVTARLADSSMARYFGEQDDVNERGISLVGNANVTSARPCRIFLTPTQ